MRWVEDDDLGCTTTLPEWPVSEVIDRVFESVLRSRG
jgi:hypothetical protein